MEFSENQVLLLEELSLANYISEITEHCRIIFPGLMPLFDRESLRKYFSHVINLAKQSDYTQRGPVRLYIDMTIMFGVRFEYDPLYRWLNNNIDHALPQLEKSMANYLLVDQYTSAICGMDCVFFDESHANFQSLSINSLPSHVIDGGKKLHELLMRIYPQRYKIVGENAIDKLIALSDIHSKNYDMKNESDKTYLIVIMFLFGCEFDKDYFRTQLIMPSLLNFFSGNRESSHSKIASAYSCFKINHATL